ncbi:MAG: protein DedA [marine bacterium B5-7]|nr:MAG: protein DedA [marine bacterium B5-7]
MPNIINFILHFDQHLAQLAMQYGSWMYAILFLIVFCETGLVVTPFLPGDSLIFAAGALASRGVFDIHLLVILLVSAAFCGDNVNYFLGRKLGVKAFTLDTWFLRQKYLRYTEHFYEEHGGTTLILARFMPIVRTFAPFVAGIGHMRYPRFLAFSITGAVFWVCLLGYTSFWFGNVPFVKEHFSWVVMGIIVLSVLPPLVKLVRVRIN